jgi:hypothetical protein
MGFYKTGAVCFFLLISGLAGFPQNAGYNPDHIFSVKELKDDFVFLKTNLEKIHPNLYLYTTRARLDLFFDSLKQSLTKPLTGIGFFNLITLLHSRIKDGHSMFLPGQDVIDYFNKYSRFFPFAVIIKKDRLFITSNYSSDNGIRDGTEILGINGIGTAECLHALIERQIRDGYNQTYPVWILSNYFKEYYGFLYGHPDSFLITCKYK